MRREEVWVMLRWKNGTVKAEFPKVDAFLIEIDEVCKRHGLSISHEDAHGSFLVAPYDAEHLVPWLPWLMSADVDGVE